MINGTIAGLLIWIIGAFIVSAMASGYNHPDITINNYYETPAPANVETQAVGSPTTLNITNGVSESDLNAGISVALAAGAHQFDYSTTSIQASVQAGFEASEIDEGKVSFGVAKRFKAVDALFSASYTPDGSQDWVTVGGTWRF